MSESKRPADLDEAVERRRARREAFQRDGERSLASNLALVGTLGWLIVVPTLIGTFLGRWIDRKTSSGVTFTSACLFLGTCVGCLLAWKKVRSA
ncbi:MAG: AtpZ/AtpI family protein [Polyangiaceae bacterium]